MFILMPLDLESMIVGHGAKIEAWRNRRVLKCLASRFRFAFKTFF
jgi:hypothetical protein